MLVGVSDLVVQGGCRLGIGVFSLAFNFRG